MDQIKIGTFIKELRKAKGLSQKELSDRLNVSDRTISKWERGVSDPSTTNLLSLANLYGFKVDEILKQIAQNKNIS